MEAPLPLEKMTPKNETKKIKFDLKESFEIKENENIFILNLSLNENLIFFEIFEKNIISNSEYNIYLSLEELGKINRYFLQFDTLKEVFESLKTLIKKKNVNIIKEEKQIKIKIINPANDKEFFINIPLKEKDLKSEINSIMSYISSLNEKVITLENKLNEIYIYKNDLEQLIKEKKKEKYDLTKSSIIYKNEINSLINWLENKPENIVLLLDSKIDGDLTQTFYKKCNGKSPTIVLVKTTKGRRFGAYSTIPWANQRENYSSSDENFIFSLDKNKKYKILGPGMAIQTNNDYFGFFDFYIYNNCTSISKNFVHSVKNYNTTESFEINFGEENFTVLSYEVYQINY